MSAVEAAQRFTRRHPCPVCGGGDDMARGKGKRCSGFLSADGHYARCTREEHAGSLELDHKTDPPAFLHRLAGDCRCGVTHGPAPGATARKSYFVYEDEKGQPLYRTARLDGPDGKRIWQERYEDGRWVEGLGRARRVLYRLPELVDAETVHVVEGERCADALAELGFVATTSPMGAGKWKDEIAAPLGGAFAAYVWPDCDPEGRAHAETAAQSLSRLGVVSTRIIELAPERDDGYDVADLLAAGARNGRREDLRAWVETMLEQALTLDTWLGTRPAQLESSSEPVPSPEADAFTTPFAITVYSARDLAALELPKPAEPIAGPWLRRGMATLVGGITGHGKTTFIAHLLKRAADGGEYLGEQVAGGARALVLDLEQHLASIQRELREAGLEESDAIDYAPIPEGLALDKRSDQLAAVEALLAAKPYDALVIDPFYKLHEADSSDELQARLLVALLRRWISEYGFALLTATHCRKLPAGRTAISLDDLFGSSLFTRDPELVLGIQRHGNITKLHVFKSREPGLEAGDVLELLFSRERGFWPRPIVDPEEREAELERVGIAAREWIETSPGRSTNAVKTAVGSALKIGGDKVEMALERQVKSGLLPNPVRGSRNSKLWYPLNHAALTSPESLLGEVSEGAPRGQSEDDFTRPSDFYVVEEGRVGEVAEARPEDVPQLSTSPASDRPSTMPRTESAT